MQRLGDKFWSKVEGIHSHDRAESPVYSETTTSEPSNIEPSSSKSIDCVHFRDIYIGNNEKNFNIQNIIRIKGNSKHRLRISDNQIQFNQINRWNVLTERYGHFDGIYVVSILFQNIVGFSDDFMKAEREAAGFNFASVQIKGSTGKNKKHCLRSTKMQ